MKANTVFKVESTIPYMAFDWKHGVASAGDIVPFFHEGSYLYTGLSVGKNLNNGTITIQNVTLGEGVRLNAFTRPFIRWTLDQVTFHQLEKSTVLDAIAKGNSTGILAGHNTQGPDQKVLFNDIAGFVGFEIMVGADPNAPSAQAVNRTREWYLK